MLKAKENRKSLTKRIPSIISCIIIVCACILSFDKLNFPTVMNDEFGYLGNAAYLAGYNWSEILTDIPYYSYGYSLILVPLFLILKNGCDIYIGVEIINTIGLIASFFALNYTCGKLFGDISAFLRNLICLVATLSAYTYIMAGYALAECILFFSICFWIAWLIFLLEEPSALKSVVLGMLVAYIHLIHQRALAIVVATSLTILLLCLIKKIDKKTTLAYYITLLVALFLQIEGKEIIKNAIWDTRVGTLENDYGGLYSVIFSLLSIDGIINFIVSFITKLYSIFVSYFFIPMFFLEHSLKLCWEGVKRKKLDTKTIIFITLMLALICAFGITALFVMYPTRRDAIIYSRYVEYLLGPVMALGLCALINVGHKFLRIIIYIGIGFIGGGFVLKAWTWVENDNFISISSPVLSLFFENNTLHVFLALIFMGLIFGIFSVVFSQKRDWIKSLILLAMVTISIFMGNKVKANWTQFDDIKECTLDIGREIEERISEKNCLVEVFIIREPEEYYTLHFYGGFIQQYLPRVSMSYVTKDTIDRFQESAAEYVIIVGENRDELRNAVEMENFYLNDKLFIAEKEIN